MVIKKQLYSEHSKDDASIPTKVQKHYSLIKYRQPRRAIRQPNRETAEQHAQNTRKRPASANPSTTVARQIIAEDSSRCQELSDVLA